MSAASRPSSTTRHKHQILTLHDSPHSSSLSRKGTFNLSRCLRVFNFSGSNSPCAKRIKLRSASVPLVFDRGVQAIVGVRAVANNRLSTIPRLSRWNLEKHADSDEYSVTMAKPSSFRWTMEYQLVRSKDSGTLEGL